MLEIYNIIALTRGTFRITDIEREIGWMGDLPSRIVQVFQKLKPDANDAGLHEPSHHNFLAAAAIRVISSKLAGLSREVMRRHLNRARKAAKTIQPEIGCTAEYENLGVNAPTWQPVSAVIRPAISHLHPDTVAIDVPQGEDGRGSLQRIWNACSNGGW
jgi:hypothetical protein